MFKYTINEGIRIMLNRIKKMLLVVPLTLSISLANAGIIDTVNPAGLPEQSIDYGWNAENAGWVYTPTFSYTMQGVNTLFGPDTRNALPQTVTLEIFDSVGGTLLRTASFQAASNTWSGATIADLLLTAGEDYFIGFRDITDLQANVNADGTAPTELAMFYNFAGESDYGRSGTFTQALLQFEGVAVPEPTTLALIGLGLAGIGWRRKVKTQR